MEHLAWIIPSVMTALAAAFTLVRWAVGVSRRLDRVEEGMQAFAAHETSCAERWQENSARLAEGAERMRHLEADTAEIKADVRRLTDKLL